MPFRGYFKIGDPRGPLFASRGAKWPTCPAWRFRLGSETATGKWEFLKTTGILFQYSQGAAEATRWIGIADVPPCFTQCTVDRNWVPVLSLVRWTLTVNFNCLSGPATISKTMTPGHAANNDVKLGEIIFPPELHLGETGVMTLYQVEYDATQPPNGWPPWA